MDKLTKELEEKFPNSDTSRIRQLQSIITKGAEYQCDEPHRYKWTSNKLEAKCPKCGSHRISLTLAKGPPRKSFGFYNIMEDSP